MIDDDVEFLEEASEIIGHTGYDSVSMTDVGYTIGKLRAEKPDVVLLDLKMKKMSGLQIAMEIRKDKLLKNIPVISMSYIYLENDVMGTCGICSRLMKPFYPEDVIEVVGKAMSRG